MSLGTPAAPVPQAGAALDAAEGELRHVREDDARGDRGLICFSAGSHGTAGDIRPLIALALALRRRGFAILVYGDVAFERSALRSGIAPSEWFTCSEVPQTFWLRTTAGQRGQLGQRPRYRDRSLRRELALHAAERTAIFWRTVGGRDNPRIVAAVGSIAAVRMLWSFGAHCAKIISCPMPYQPSQQFTLDPPDLSPAGRLRAWVKRRHFQARLYRPFCEETFHLVSASPSVFPRPDDWLPNMQVTGYIPLAEDRQGWSPPPALADFLARGPAPVYAGFGSFAFLFGARGEALARTLIDGCRRAGRRCIIQSADLPRSLASDQVYVLDEDVPHDWLFPRCAVVVHHGGYGTLHAALVAQRPMVVYPVHTDQFLWTTRMGEAGVGPGFTARLRDLTADRLQQDLAFALRPACEASARQLGAAVAAEQGLPVQVAAIESIVEHTQRGQPPSAWQPPRAGAGAAAMKEPA